MAETLAFSPLSLNLPNSRMSVDFSSFATTQLNSYNGAAQTNRVQPQPPVYGTVARRPVAKPLPLPKLEEEVSPLTSGPSRQSSRKWLWTRASTTRGERSESPVTTLSRTNSSASTGSSASNSSTVVSSVFSNAPSISTARTSHSSMRYANSLESCPEEAAGLSSLPLSLLEHILEYVLCVPLTVSIGPQNTDNRHMQYRYHRAGLDYMDIQLILKHPVFMVSHRFREVALDVFYRKCDFVIDLQRIYHTRVASTMNDNLKRHQKFWINDPPKMVRETLRNVSKLHLRLPVPCSEANAHRGREEDSWMDGSDGQGGGGWRIKSLKREQEDAVEIQKCLEAIMKLVMTDLETDQSARGRPGTLSRTGSFRRMGSLQRSRSKSRERQSQGHGASTPDSDDNDGKRKPLKRLEVDLVKRNSYVMVLPAETLGLIKILRSVPVTGFTKYFFELEEQKMLWATKYRKRWQGFEPDGTRLLADLQGLAVAARPIEPIRTPTEFKFVNVGKGGKLQLAEYAIPRTPIALDRPNTAEKNLPNAPPLPANATVRRKPGTWPWKKSHKRNDSFAHVIEEGMDVLGSSGTSTSGRNQPPTVDELRKIAEDIRNGLY